MMKQILSFFLLFSMLLSAAAGTTLAFEDVPEDMWYSEAVEYIQKHELMPFIEESSFQPDAAMTQGMAATVVWTLYGAPKMPYDEPTFSDLRNEDWYYHAATWGYLTDVIIGFYLYPDRPNDPPTTGFGFEFRGVQEVSREQFALIMFRYAKYCKLDTSKRIELHFPDAKKVTQEGLNAMQWAVAEGLILGSKDDGELLLAPQRSITRAEAAAMVMRYCETYEITFDP